MAKRLQAMLPPAAQGQNPQVMQMQQQMQQMGQQLQQTQQQLQEKQSELQIKQFEAETKRLALQQSQQPTEGAAPPDHSPGLPPLGKPRLGKLDHPSATHLSAG